MKRSGEPQLPPQRRSLQQRFSPHAKAKDGAGTLKRLLALYAQWKKDLIWVAAFTLLAAGSSLAAPYLMGRAVDCFRLEPPYAVERGRLCRMLVLLTACVLLQWLGNQRRRSRMEEVSQRMVGRIRADCFAKLERLPLSYFDRHPRGDIMSRLVNDADNVSIVAAETLTQLLHSVLMAVGAVAVMLALSPVLTTAVFATMPASVLCTRLISQLSRRLYQEQAAELGRMGALVQETVQGRQMIKLFGREAKALDEFDGANRTLCRLSVRAQVCAGLLSPLVHMISSLGFALIACAGGFLILRGQARVGLVVAFLGYSQQLGRPFSSIAAIFTSIQQAVAGAERLFEILDEREDAPDRDGAVKPVKIRGDVEFQNVTFSYLPGRPVLKDVSFSVKAGELAAFVGETGAGKTTIANLLTRFYDPDSGRILLDGIPLTQYNRSGLKRCFSVVLQDAVFFSGTILDNLRCARPSASVEEVEQAAALAQIHECITGLPRGYQTWISGGAELFSQGQRQLLSIARALLRDTPILILDEATSSVDVTTEERIRQAMNHAVEGRTCFMIAHRLSTVRRADRIFVVGNQRILEAGTHAELMERHGAYWRMVKGYSNEPEGG